MRHRFLNWLPWLVAALIIVLALWPRLDLIVSGWFYARDAGFTAVDNRWFVLAHKFGTQGAWVLGALLAIILAYTTLFRRDFFGLGAKGWLFLLLGLLIGPGLLANTILKDHWGRARPHQVVEFGGSERFTPFYAPQPVTHSNGSFIAGDPSFGFYLPSFAFVLRPRRYPNLLFWGGMAIGGLLSFVRLAMGAHFLSDILCALVLMTAVSLTLFGVMYGPRAARDCWREQMGLNH